MFEFFRVNTDMYQQLLDMGFGKGAVREALRQSNNHIGHALEVGSLYWSGDLNFVGLVKRTRQQEILVILFKFSN